MRGAIDVCGCFPTGRHYPGIADRIARAIETVPGLCEEWSAGKIWSEIPLVVIDFETTGTDPENDRVLEMGIVCFEKGQVTRSDALLIDPTIPVPEESRAIHGITDEELEGAPTFIEALPQILKLLEGHLPVAYNADFDRDFLLAEFARSEGKVRLEGGLPPAVRQDVSWVDPLVWSREILKERRKHRLVDITAHFEIPLEQAHRAAGDAEATGHVLMALAPNMPSVYGELIRLQGRYAAFQEAARPRFRRR